LEKIVFILKCLWFSLGFEVFGTTHFILAHLVDILETTPLQPFLNLNEGSELLNKFIKDFLESAKYKAKSQNGTTREQVGLEDILLHKFASILKDVSESNLFIKNPEIDNFQPNNIILKKFKFLFKKNKI
jgi:hypothetical protein